MGKHDLLFRKTFKEVPIFREVLNFYLPDDIKSKLKLDTLKLRKLSGSFIRSLAFSLGNEELVKDSKAFERFKEEIADLVFVCEENSGGEVLLINHLEHQSTPDKNFALRNALYDISALKDYVDEKKPEKYPLVISMMIYHGKVSPYPYPIDIIEVFKEPELAKEYFLKPILIDYGQIKDEELITHGVLSAPEIALKHAFNPNITD